MTSGIPKPSRMFPVLLIILILKKALSASGGIEHDDKAANLYPAACDDLNTDLISGETVI